MIHEVDASIGELIRNESLGDSTEVDVAFDAPTTDWSSRRNAPTINLFLYDIREDLTRRDVAPLPVRNADGHIVDRRPAPRRFKLSYLITAWTQRPEDEHRLLAQVLSALIAHDAVPEQYLTGTLSELNLPVLLQLALPPTADRSLSDIWTALGGELKPSIDLRVIAPLATGRRFHVGPPALETPRLVLDDDRTSTKGGRGRRAQDTTREPFAEPDDDGAETVRAGTRAQPGRTFRMRPIARRPVR
jgi:Pvc16 N-terminal domain